MKALYFNEHGGINKLHFGEVDNPKLQPDEVLVRVSACALNHMDLFVLQGWAGLKIDPPHIGGADISGEIVEIGSDVMNWNPGANVVVNPGLVTVDDEWTRRG